MAGFDSYYSRKRIKGEKIPVGKYLDRGRGYNEKPLSGDRSVVVKVAYRKLSKLENFLKYIEKECEGVMEKLGSLNFNFLQRMIRHFSFQSLKTEEPFSIF